MKLLAVDGNSLINRAFYGVKLLTTKDGQYTNGIYGFINMLNKILELENPDSVAVAFDLKKPTFRHEIYKEYKAGRKGMPDELAQQLPVLKEWLSFMGYSVLSLEGYEADDILGTLAKLSEESGNECIIATGDRDSFQLVSEKTRVLLTVTKMGKPEIDVYTPEVIKEKYGVEPKGMIEIKALQGDSSDNIPGVAGVGEKTAKDLISRFESIENIYLNLDTLDIKDSLREKLRANKENAFLSHTLGTIKRDVPISKNMDDYALKPKDTENLVRLLRKLEFFSILKKMNLENEDVLSEQETKNYNLSSKKEFIDELEKSKEISVVFDPKTLDFGFCTGNICVLKNGGNMTDFIEIKSIFENEEIEKQATDLKNIYKWTNTNGIEFKTAVFDSSLAAYLINPSASDYEIERLSAEYNAAVPNFDGEVPSVIKKAANLRETAFKLKEELEKRELENLLKTIEIPLSRVLADMEIKGFLVDTDGIVKMGERLAEKISLLEKNIFSFAGHEFNINSPKQLGVVLFEELMLPFKKKTKSGYSTGAEILEGLKGIHPIIEEILEYRKLVKLKNTYCDGLPLAADRKGRIHSTLNQTETRTGRISSLEPNLQNIPVRQEEGRELRKYFKAKDGYLLIDADYSQIELRVLAHMSEDKMMINAFLGDTDIHTVTASQVFNMPENMVTPIMRSRAKAVNFGIVYGIGAFSLSKDIGVSFGEAKDYIKNYLLTYSGVDRYMKETVEKAKENGFVTTIFGRRRYLPELNSSNGMQRSFGERVARNMPIQGTAADIIKIAMIRVSKRLKEEGLDAGLIMQIHDELIVEASEKDAKKAGTILKEEMESAAVLSVPLVVDMNIGKTWYDAKG